MPIKPWLDDETWFARYAARAAELKGLAGPDELAAAERGIKRAFQTIYRAVAVDIDGTLTHPDSVDVDGEMAELVGALLQRSVPVILSTGRGRSSARAAAEQILARVPVSSHVLRRLLCVTHNGVFLLETEDGNGVLQRELLMLEEDIDVVLLAECARAALAQAGVGAADAEISHEPASIRVSFAHAEAASRAVPALRVARERYGRQPLALRRGRYGGLLSLDLTPTDKGKALAVIARRMGIGPENILRLGDQGSEDGNDFDLLDTPAGFSVRELSRSPRGCYPVLDHDLRLLRDVAAARRALELALVFPALTLAPERSEDIVRELRRFDRAASSSARRASDTASNRLRLTFTRLLERGDDVRDLRLSDVFDPASGAVRLREWELDELGPDDAGAALFELDRLAAARGAPRTHWSMFTDTAAVLRGPRYYFGRTVPRELRTLEVFLERSRTFVSDALVATEELAGREPSLLRYKLALGVADNVRNILLQLQAAAFSFAGARQEAIRRAYEALLAHADAHFGLLFEPGEGWAAALERYRRALGLVNRALAEELLGSRRVAAGEDPFRSFREGDDFVQNVTAVELGLDELRRHEGVHDAPALIALGIMYGGAELPALAHVVSRRRGFSVRPALAHVSLYGRSRAAAESAFGGRAYIRHLAGQQEAICFVSGEDSTLDDPVVLFDDSCTTATTIQTARDLVILRGADVAGAVVVRYPGVNRAAQMAMRDHGFPDPDVLFSFVRGLVAPSPYTRLTEPAAGANPYLDESGVFDKAKARIVRYLAKNGTPAVDP